MIDSNFGVNGVGNAGMSLSRYDKLLTFVERKEELRDVQNKSTVGNSLARSPLLQKMDVLKVSGNKRSSPEDPVSPPHYQSPSNANTQLVYVRRKTEAEMGKTGSCDVRTSNADCALSRQLGQQETIQSDQLINEPKVLCSPVSSPMPVGSLTNSYGKLSVLLPDGQPKIMFASAASSLNNTMDERHLHWEERYRQLQILLKKLDESDKEDYLKKLLPLSSDALSRHAFELEKKSIQLSLEEAKEVHRVGMLNVLGKSRNPFKA